MTFEGMGEMFEGDSADTCAGKFPLVSMGGRAEGCACEDPEARTPIGASGNFKNLLVFFFFFHLFLRHHQVSAETSNIIDAKANNSNIKPKKFQQMETPK